ncbi:MAG TPA: isoprenylcysteine carboxylmethyltransferase family protein [Rhizomicrobium sp.]|nr:isoprenylcysteine carboxylmethyltransferase family protein [Rhizomicrobium sp.]
MWHGMWPDTAIYIPWWIWAITWVAASVWANQTVKRAGFNREWFYRLLALGGFVFLLGGYFRQHNGHISYGRWPGILGDIIWQPPLEIGWALVIVTFLGFAFAWWARIHLGRLWSGSITRKEGHHVVDSGPYGIVRHPIYTGILLSGVASAVVMGTPHAYIGAALLIVAYWVKARLEERWLREELGPEAYDAYRRRVPMLLPFGPKAV